MQEAFFFSPENYTDEETIVNKVALIQGYRKVLTTNFLLS